MGTKIIVPIINHLLIFGFKPNVLNEKDVRKYKKDKFGFQLYISEFFNSLWYEKFRCGNYENKRSVLRKLGYSKEKRELFTSRKKWHYFSRGFVTFGDVSFQSCSYVCRYILKKQNKSDNLLSAYEQEFLGVSNGIGLRWLQDNYKTVFANGHINYVVNGKIKHCPIPRYFIEKLKDIDEEYYNKVKKDAYANLLTRVDNFDEISKGLEDLKSNEKYLQKVTYHKYKRSFENEKSL